MYTYFHQPSSIHKEYKGHLRAVEPNKSCTPVACPSLHGGKIALTVTIGCESSHSSSLSDASHNRWHTSTGSTEPVACAASGPGRRPLPHAVLIVWPVQVCTEKQCQHTGFALSSYTPICHALMVWPGLLGRGRRWMSLPHGAHQEHRGAAQEQHRACDTCTSAVKG